MHPSIGPIVAGVATLRPDDLALSAALRLSGRLGAELHLVHVVRSGAPMPPDPPDVLREVAEQAEPGATTTGRVVCRVVTGAPEHRLLDVASETDADLLVLGETRRSALAGTMLGTTAGRVLRGARASILVMRGPLPDRPLRVLLTTDLSRHAVVAHARGGSLAHALSAPGEAEMRSLFVEPPVLKDVPILNGAAEAHAERELIGFLRAEAPPSPSTPCVRIGDPAFQIVREAVEWEADLLVLGTHGRRGAARFFLGSVAETVLRHAPCATLVIPPLRPDPMQAVHPGAAGRVALPPPFEIAGTR